MAGTAKESQNGEAARERPGGGASEDALRARFWSGCGMCMKSIQEDPPWACAAPDGESGEMVPDKADRDSRGGPWEYRLKDLCRC